MKHILLSSVFLFCFFAFSAQAQEKNIGGVDHIGLSVSDLQASTAFFVETLEFKVSGRDSKYPAVFMNNGDMSLTLWQTNDSSVAFNRKANVGLHHLAIKVKSFAALESLHDAVRSFPGVVVEFAPELAYGGPAKHMMIREPSGNRLELVHRP